MIHHISKSQARVIQESSISNFYEYPSPFGSFSTGISIINGRYPRNGYAIDEGVDATWYVASGTGQLSISGNIYDIVSGDMIYVPKCTPFFIDGVHLELVVTSSPQWTSDQHKQRDNL